ncbi:hypothetical protein F4859DRAFT_489017, partial [Xylaria cf. heliscus]
MTRPRRTTTTTQTPATSFLLGCELLPSPFPALIISVCLFLSFLYPRGNTSKHQGIPGNKRSKLQDTYLYGVLSATIATRPADHTRPGYWSGVTAPTCILLPLSSASTLLLV